MTAYIDIQETLFITLSGESVCVILDIDNEPWISLDTVNHLCALNDAYTIRQANLSITYFMFNKSIPLVRIENIIPLLSQMTKTKSQDFIINLARWYKNDLYMYNYCKINKR